MKCANCGNQFEGSTAMCPVCEQQLNSLKGPGQIPGAGPAPNPASAFPPGGVQGQQSVHGQQQNPNSGGAPNQSMGDSQSGIPQQNFQAPPAPQTDGIPGQGVIPQQNFGGAPAPQQPQQQGGIPQQQGGFPPQQGGVPQQQGGVPQQQGGIPPQQGGIPQQQGGVPQQQGGYPQQQGGVPQQQGGYPQQQGGVPQQQGGYPQQQGGVPQQQGGYPQQQGGVPQQAPQHYPNQNTGGAPQPGAGADPGAQLQKKTVMADLPYNLAAAACYVPIVVNFVAGAAWLYSEPKENRFVRYHAVQGFVVLAAFMVLSLLNGTISFLLGWIPMLNMVFPLFNAVVLLAYFGLCFQIGIRVFKGNPGKLPIVSGYIEDAMDQYNL